MISCGFIVQKLLVEGDWNDVGAYRVMFGIYAILGLVKLGLSSMLSQKCEAETQAERHEYQPVTQTSPVEAEFSDSEEEGEDETRNLDGDGPPATPILPEIKKKSIWPAISPESRTVLIKLCMLFAVDSLASGLVPLSWITYFFNRKFELPESDLGTLFFVTNIVASMSNLVASSLSKRIGPIKTMVFTHLPSAIFLALIPIPSQVWLAMLFLVLRSCTSTMDAAPRQAFLSAVVLPNERTAIMGMVNVVKTLSQSVGPVVTGGLAETGNFWIAFLVAGAMKTTYDLAMLTMFLGYKSREEEDPKDVVNGAAAGQT